MKKFKAKAISERTVIKDLAEWYVQASKREKEKAYRNLDRILSKVQFLQSECEAYTEYAPQYFGLEWDDDYDDDSPRHCLMITFDNTIEGLMDIPLIPQCPYETLGDIIDILKANDMYWHGMDDDIGDMDDDDMDYYMNDPDYNPVRDLYRIWHENPDKKSWEIDFIYNSVGGRLYAKEGEEEKSQTAKR